MLSIVAKWWIQPGREDDTVAALRELASAGEQEPVHDHVHDPCGDSRGIAPEPAEQRGGLRNRLAGPRGVPAAPGRSGVQELDREICPLFLTDDGGGLCVTGEFMDGQAGYVRPAATGPGA